MFDLKSILIIVTPAILIGFLIGWLNPVEGPFDYVYDEYAAQPAHKRPPTVPVQKEKDDKFTISITDLSIDDLELMEEIFKRNKGMD